MIKIELSEKKPNEPDMVCVTYPDDNGVEQTLVTENKHFLLDQNFSEDGFALLFIKEQ